MNNKYIINDSVRALWDHITVLPFTHAHVVYTQGLSHDR